MAAASLNCLLSLAPQSPVPVNLHTQSQLDGLFRHFCYNKDNLFNARNSGPAQQALCGANLTINLLFDIRKDKHDV